MVDFTFSGRTNPNILEPAHVSDDAATVLKDLPFQIDRGDGPADGNDYWVSIPEGVLLKAFSAIAPEITDGGQV